MGVLALVLQAHEVDDVDDPHAQLGQVLVQQGRGRQDLERGGVPGAAQDHVGLLAVVGARPGPDPDAAGAVGDRLVHRQPVRRRLLAGDHHVDVVAAAQAVVHHRQQRVGVRRQVDPDDPGLLVDDVVDEAGVLVGEAVVVLAPDVRAQQVVQRRDRAPPGDAGGDLQPLRVLVEHRVHDVDERLVAVEEAVAARQQVALEPALAEVLAEHLHDAAVRREVVVAGEPLRHPRAVGRLEHGAEAVRRGLVRTEDPEVLRVGVRAQDVAQPQAEDAGGLADTRARRLQRDAVVPEVGQPQRPAAPRRRWPAAARPSAARPRARAPGARAAAARRRRRAPRAGRSASRPRARSGAPGGRPVPRAAPGGRGTSPRRARRRPPSARSSPSACAGRSSASAGARRCRRSRGSPRGRRGRWSSVSAMSAWTAAGSSPADDVGLVAVADEERAQLVVGEPREDRRVGDLVAVEVQDGQHRAVARRVDELVRVPAGGERPGLRLAVADDAGDEQVRVVEGRAVGVRRARSRARPPRGSTPASPARRGSGSRPGKENWRTSRRSPSSSRVTSGYTSL